MSRGAALAPSTTHFPVARLGGCPLRCSVLSAPTGSFLIKINGKFERDNTPCAPPSHHCGHTLTRAEAGLQWESGSGLLLRWERCWQLHRFGAPTQGPAHPLLTRDTGLGGRVVPNDREGGGRRGVLDPAGTHPRTQPPHPHSTPPFSIDGRGGMKRCTAQQLQGWNLVIEFGAWDG